MRAKEEYRNRDDAEVALLDALADRGEEGLTVFELRSHVDVEIDTIEDALAELKTDGLIEVHEDNNRTVIVPDADVITAEEPDDDGSLLDDLKRRFF